MNIYNQSIGDDNTENIFIKSQHIATNATSFTTKLQKHATFSGNSNNINIHHLFGNIGISAGNELKLNNPINTIDMYKDMKLLGKKDIQIRTSGQNSLLHLRSAAGSVKIEGSNSSNNALELKATHKYGGINLQSGKNGINIDTTGKINISSQNVQIDNDLIVRGKLKTNGNIEELVSIKTNLGESLINLNTDGLMKDVGIIGNINNTKKVGLYYDVNYDKFVLSNQLSISDSGLITNIEQGNMKMGELEVNRLKVGNKFVNLDMHYKYVVGNNSAFKTIQSAIDYCEEQNQEQLHIIEIINNKIYNEHLIIKKPNIHLIGNSKYNKVIIKGKIEIKIENKSDNNNRQLILENIKIELDNNNNTIYHINVHGKDKSIYKIYLNNVDIFGTNGLYVDSNCSLEINNCSIKKKVNPDNNMSIIDISLCETLTMSETIVSYFDNYIMNETILKIDNSNIITNLSKCHFNGQLQLNIKSLRSNNNIYGTNSIPNIRLNCLNYSIFINDVIYQKYINLPNIMTHWIEKLNSNVLESIVYHNNLTHLVYYKDELLDKKSGLNLKMQSNGIITQQLPRYDNVFHNSNPETNAITTYGNAQINGDILLNGKMYTNSDIYANSGLFVTGNVLINDKLLINNNGVKIENNLIRKLDVVNLNRINNIFIDLTRSTTIININGKCSAKLSNNAINGQNKIILINNLKSNSAFTLKLDINNTKYCVKKIRWVNTTKNNLAPSGYSVEFIFYDGNWLLQNQRGGIVIYNST